MTIKTEVATVNGKTAIFLYSNSSSIHLGWGDLQSAIEQLSEIHMAHLGEGELLRGGSVCNESNKPTTNKF